MTSYNIPTITLPDGKTVPTLGQGTWYMGETKQQHDQEVEVLRQGIDYGLTLIDTAEMYADGGAERVVGDAISGQRDKVYLVSKVLPMHANYKGTLSACENSLRRLKTDFIDLYLLHWRSHIPLSETISAMEQLINDQKIGAWGVSNFDLEDMQELSEFTNIHHVCTNQVLFNLTRRGIEYDLLPWCQQQKLPIMAYSPIEQGRLLKHPCLNDIALKHRATPAQIALAWVLTHQHVIAIPKTSQLTHLKQNIGCLSLQLDANDIDQLNQAFPAPTRKIHLQML